MSKIKAIFSIPELRQKILITLLFLAIYRIGYYVPLPFIDQGRLEENMRSSQSGALGQALGLVSMFSGGTLSQAVIFSWGVMPYISASIIFQLLASVYPPLEKLQKEGESGRKKINEYTRYATVPIAFLQSYMVVSNLMGSTVNAAAPGYGAWYFQLTAMVTMTVGTLFLMWLGEQIDEYGIGNGISLIIMAGIIARIPQATSLLLFDPNRTYDIPFFKWTFHLPALKESILTLGGGGGTQDVSFEKFVVLIFLFVAVVVAVIAITKGQRRIPTQSAKHVRGRRVYGGTRQYLPLRVNQAGVMPVIFAGSLLAIPSFLFNLIYKASGGEWSWAEMVSAAFIRQGYVYNVFYIALIYFFCYFWTAIIFNPKDMANNLKDYGSFIPGYRPGRRTAEYLERVMMRITYVGAAFLAVIAIIPSLMANWMEVDWRVANFYGGTGLLIVISVALDLVQKINSHLVMRNYPGLTED
ncbi:MAG TPA: preprotein translocase subunit SecY [Gemmataceae bacterium]|nr:preprotein translocase subunit SecY [Gemmataceae bacterium]